MFSEKMKETLEKDIGLPLSKIYEMDVDEEIAYVEEKTGKKLKFQKRINPRIVGRGNPLLARNKIVTIEEINSKIDTKLRSFFGNR